MLPKPYHGYADADGFKNLISQIGATSAMLGKKTQTLFQSGKRNLSSTTLDPHLLSGIF